MANVNLTVEDRVAELERQVKEILSGHEGAHRDDLLKRVQSLEKLVEMKENKSGIFEPLA